MGIKNGFKRIKGALNRTVKHISGQLAFELYTDQTAKYFEKLFDVKDEKEHVVFTNIDPDIVQINIHMLYPTADRHFYVLFTTGMSDLPMTMPEGTEWGEKVSRERAEIFCLLPESFSLDKRMNENQRYKWALSVLSYAAQFPHRNKSWLGSCHSLQYSMDNEPFSPHTRLSSAVFIQLDGNDFGGKYKDAFNGYYPKEGTYINLLCLIPIYEEELKFKRENGAGGLFFRLFGETVTDFSQLVIDETRPNAALTEHQTVVLQGEAPAFSAGEMPYNEEIREHFKKVFGVKDSSEYDVFHETLSDAPYPDVYLLKATEERPFQVLFTAGMSALPMTMPEGAPEDHRKAGERAELYCILPADRRLDNNMTDEEKEQYSWIISAVKTAARYPHMCGTRLLHGHTLQFGEKAETFSQCTRLCAAVFYRLDHTDFGGKYGDDLMGFTAADGTYINLLCFVPIYEEEMNFKLENGAGDLYERLFGERIDDIRQLAIENDRKNTCMQ